MRRLLFVIALALAGCQTHTVGDCRSECDSDDVARFSQCVASGRGPCAAGDRRCCALEVAQCLGVLDDQRVVPAASCMSVIEEACFPPCDDMAITIYDACVEAGSSTCSAGDVTCCALAVDCLGDLGDVYVSADGCCVDDFDCDLDEVCDPHGECVLELLTEECGDGIVEGSEECDDENTITDACDYGLMSCVVCSADCTEVAGAVSFCGDGALDPNEECDPPARASCDADCHDILPSTCGNGSFDGDETDFDCGGSCEPCKVDQMCVLDSDCQATSEMCPSSVGCDDSSLSCYEIDVCDDGEFCTVDFCGATGGCGHAMLDEDMDGVAPLLGGCGLDCDDGNPRITPNNPDDMCRNGVDDDCDGLIDEGC